MTNYLLKYNEKINEIVSLDISDNHSNKNGIINGIKIKNLIYFSNNNIDLYFNRLIKLIEDELESDDDSDTVKCLDEIEYFKGSILPKYRKYLTLDEYEKYIKYIKKYSIIIKEKLNRNLNCKKGR